MNIDIIIFAVISGLVLWRLYKVLGTRDGFEGDPKRRNMFDPPEKPATKPAMNMVIGDDADVKDGIPLSLSGVMAQIKMADRSFDEKRFLRGARLAFEMIIKAFADGDKAELKTLLTPHMYEAYAKIIDDHKKRGEKHDITIVRLRDPDITDASISGKDAFITVTYKSEQISATQNKDGKTVEGDSDRIMDVTDIWTYTRPIGSASSKWYLHETKSGA